MDVKALRVYGNVLPLDAPIALRLTADEIGRLLADDTPRFVIFSVSSPETR